MVIENPAADGPRLVYADFLEERGETDRAEFIRVQCELEHLKPDRLLLPVYDKWLSFERPDTPPPKAVSARLRTCELDQLRAIVPLVGIRDMDGETHCYAWHASLPANELLADVYNRDQIGHARIYDVSVTRGIGSIAFRLTGEPATETNTKIFDLQRREVELLGLQPNCPYYKQPAMLASDATYRRGFVEAITMSFVECQRYLHEILEKEPIQEVTITGPPPRVCNTADLSPSVLLLDLPILDQLVGNYFCSVRCPGKMCIGSADTHDAAILAALKSAWPSVKTWTVPPYASVRRAPAGGVTWADRYFTGGQFIPFMATESPSVTS